MKLACKNKGKATRLDRLAAKTNFTVNRSPPTAVIPDNLPVLRHSCFAFHLAAATRNPRCGSLLVICGALRMIYDLTLVRMFGQVKPPEEVGNE